MNQVGLKRCKHSSENQLNPNIKINFKKKNNKDIERERNSYRDRSGALKQLGLSISRPTAGLHIRLETVGTERIGEIG